MNNAHNNRSTTSPNDNVQKTNANSYAAAQHSGSRPSPQAPGAGTPYATVVTAQQGRLQQQAPVTSAASNPFMMSGSSTTNLSGSHRYAAATNNNPPNRPTSTFGAVPNPLGLPPPPPPPAQQQQQRPPTTTTGSGVQVINQHNAKPKVILSAEAKAALTKAIWSAIRSPTGTVDPVAMREAVQTGLPQHAVQNAARVAREREASKRANAQKQKQLQEQQQRERERQQQRLQQLELQQQAALRQRQQQQEQEQQEKAAKERHQQALASQRQHWKRASSGIFLAKNGRFTTAPASVSCLMESSNVDPVVPPLPTATMDWKRDWSDAQRLQQLLMMGRGEKQSQQGGGPDDLLLLEAERYKRIKLEPKKLARGLDRHARKSRQFVAETLLKSYKELNKSISSHYTDFYKFHRQRKSDAFKIAKAIAVSMEKVDKKNEKEAAAAERARLAALKANDMAAYSKLLEETRNDRLKYLLEKTERHFDEISSLLQQRSDEQSGSIGRPNSNNNKVATSYYATAHSQNEEVRQPGILVGGELKEYQLAGLQWMVSLYNNKLNGILADEMGLGKTIQAISLIGYLMEFKQNLGPFLVIVPLSTLSNWKAEFTKWCPAARTVCYKGTPTQRRDLYKDEVRAGHFNVLLTTYEYIIRDKKYLRKHVWQYAIVDEGHRMKNAASKFAVTLGTQYTTKFRILLTGTPLMNDLSELWSLLNFLLPTIFNSVSTFDQWFSAPFAQFGGSSNNDDQQNDLLSNEERVLIIHRLHELLRPFMLRRVKSEVLDQLPEKVEKVLRCDLSSWQKELYKQISKKAVADNALTDPNASTGPARGLNNVVMQLRKVCNHPYLFTPEGYHLNDNIIRSSGKLALLDKMLPKLKAAGHRVLMFTQMTAVMTILEDYFAYRGYVSLRLDGSTPAEEREKRMYRFNAPDSPCFIFLLSTRAGGLGLNLTSADTVIIFDSDWNPAMDLQAQDRAHRIGQRSDVSVFRLITNSPVEEKILSRATEKMSVSQLVVESGQFNKGSVDNDNSQERKRLMEVLLTDFETAASTNAKPVSEKSGSDQADDDDDDAGSEESKEDDLNELLSNNETDFQLYADYDKRLHDQGIHPVELYTEDSDVPDWIKHPPSNADSKAFVAAAGGSSRKRKDVAYDDGLTEKQFLRLMDKQAIQEENARKKQKTQRGARAITATASAGGDVAVASPPEGSILTDWTYRKLISCTKSVVNLKEPSTKRRLSEIFLEKPDAATFPDYYEIIDKPIAINDILRKCRNKLYSNIPEFKDDWRLMFANARRFNGDDSWVVKDAQALEKELERVLKKNGFIDDQKPPTCKEKKKLRIKLSLKKT